jgi:ribonuclease-3
MIKDDNINSVQYKPQMNVKQNLPNRNRSPDKHYFNSEVIKINPYNPNNFLVTVEQVQEILRKVDIHIPIKNINYYRKAFTHKSYLKKMLTNKGIDIIIEKSPEVLDLQEESNERLEFLGDVVTNTCIVNHLYDRFPTEQEGFLTRLKTNLISTVWYSKFARYMGLQKYLIISKHVEEVGNGRNSDKILENVFESFMGALFKDFSTIPSVYTQKLGLLSGPGFEVCEKLVTHLLQKLIDFDDLCKNDTNYKDILQRHFQALYQTTPNYIEISVEGPPNNRIFTMAVLDINNKQIGKGIANSKKKAEQLASLEALKILGKL